MENETLLLETIGEYKVVALEKVNDKFNELFSEIKALDSNIQEEAVKLIESEDEVGIVYAVVKDEIIKGLYLFKVKKQEEQQQLVHEKTMYISTVSKESKTEVNNYIRKKIEELAKENNIDKVVYEEEIIEKEKKEFNKFSFLISVIIGFIVGAAVGYAVLDNILVGLIIGIILAPIFGCIDIGISNKRK